MALQGIPFSTDILELAVTSTAQVAHVVLDKIPMVTVDTPFAWDAILGAIITGLIPGGIAYMAIRNSYNLAKMQHILQSKSKINDEIRVAAANYVTAINYLSTDYNAWVKDVLERKRTDVSQETMPEHLRENIYRAEANKNLLTLLITPDEEGNNLLKTMGDAQAALTPFLEAKASPDDVIQLRLCVNNFLYKCHEYFIRN